MVLTVGYDATAAARQEAGIGRYARELLRALAATAGARYNYRVFHAGGRPERLPALPDEFRVRALPISDRFTNAVWHRLRLPVPIQTVVGRVDLVHSPDFTAPPSLGRPSVITIHDLAFLRRPECAYPTLREYLSDVVPRQARLASHILTVSENAKRDVVELLGVPPEKVSVGYPGVSSPFGRAHDGPDARAVLGHLDIRPPFVLAVGTLEPRKNYVRLLEAFRQVREHGFPHRLVIAGARGWLYEPIFQRLNELRLGESVTITRPDDDELRALYSLADAFVSTSVYEGFGIPAAEALASGLPVASSSASSLPEVVGDAGILFDPYEVDEMAGAIERILADEAFAASLRARAPAQAAQFTWEKTADTALRAYRTVVNG